MSRTAIVTGGGSGIGRAAALTLAKAGWRVAIAGRRQDALDAVCAETEGEMIGVAADVADEQAVKALFDQTAARFGRIDLLFNNAGVFPPTARFDEITRDAWSRTMEVNLTGAFLCAREAFRHMAAQSPQGGRIINNGSVSAQVPRPHAASYTASKHAITGLTRAIALDGRPLNIACGQIDIGNAVTSLSAGLVSGSMQASGAIAAEPTMDVADAARCILLMADLPLNANVQFMTVIATAMPFVGRG